MPRLMSRSGDFSVYNRQQIERKKTIALPLAHACRVKVNDCLHLGSEVNFKDRPAFMLQYDSNRLLLTFCNCYIDTYSGISL